MLSVQLTSKYNHIELPHHEVNFQVFIQEFNDCLVYGKLRREQPCIRVTALHDMEAVRTPRTRVDVAFC